MSSRIVFGIQGGEGSFNEEAILRYLSEKEIRKREIKYLFTTERVLKQLQDGLLDFGLFAIQNAVGGMVDESVKALCRYTCKVEEEICIPIRHFLMKRKDNELKTPRVIMAHDQVFKQCRATLKKKYPHAKLLTGRGDLIDTAQAAKALANSLVFKDTFILGPARLAEMHDLEIVASNLQDDKNNITTFLLVTRQ